jgi:hypothetical protein
VKAAVRLKAEWTRRKRLELGEKEEFGVIVQEEKKGTELGLGLEAVERGS